MAGSRKQEDLKIDPETSEVYWTYAQTLDPYGVDTNLPEECQSVGREYFARRPGSGIWVWFGDLPERTLARLQELGERVFRQGFEALESQSLAPDQVTALAGTTIEEMATLADFASAGPFLVY